MHSRRVCRWLFHSKAYNPLLSSCNAHISCISSKLAPMFWHVLITLSTFSISCRTEVPDPSYIFSVSILELVCCLEALICGWRIRFRNKDLSAGVLSLLQNGIVSSPARLYVSRWTHPDGFLQLTWWTDSFSCVHVVTSFSKTTPQGLFLSFLFLLTNSDLSPSPLS